MKGREEVRHHVLWFCAKLFGHASSLLGAVMLAGPRSSQAMFLFSHTLAWLQRGCQKRQSFFILEPTHLSIEPLESVTKSREEWVYHCALHRALALTLRQWSSSTPSSLLSAGTISLPSVQYIPRLLSDTIHVLLCPGSCCLCLAREVTLTGVLNGDSFCSHSEIQEATEMLLQELERLCSCGWLMSCWPLEIWAILLLES